MQHIRKVFGRVPLTKALLIRYAEKTDLSQCEMSCLCLVRLWAAISFITKAAVSVQQLPYPGVIIYMTGRNSFAVLALAAVLAFTGCGAAEDAAGGIKTNVGTESGSAAKAGVEARDKDIHERTIFAMTTVMSFRVYHPDGEAILDQAEEEIRRIESIFSTGDPESEISKLNAAGEGKLGGDAAQLLDRALTIYEMTDGAFDISIYPVMKAWGFTELYDDENLVEKENTPVDIPDAAVLAEAISHVDASRIELNAQTGEVRLPEGSEIDLGGIAKGYAAQRVIELFEEKGVSSAMLDLGGNVQVLGTKPNGRDWKVGIRDPAGEHTVIGVIACSDRAVVTSGGYERYITGKDGKTYHHIIDPKTGYPAENGLVSVSIVCDDGALADGLSTALYVLGTERAIECWKEHADLFDAVLLTEDGKMYVTEGIEDAFASDIYDAEVIRRA